LTFLRDLKPGAYTTAVKARDLAGNWSAELRGS
jgi:hypothetical protein